MQPLRYWVKEVATVMRETWMVVSLGGGGMWGEGGKYEDVSGDEVAAERAAVDEADEDEEEHDKGDAAEDEEDPEEPFALDWRRGGGGERGCCRRHGGFGLLGAGGVFVGDAIVAGPPLGVGNVEVRTGHGGRRSGELLHRRRRR